jgi:hypothetical protein
MTGLTRHMVRGRRAAVIGLLVAMSIAPLAACGGSDRGEVPSETENEQTGGQDGEDDGAY